MNQILPSDNMQFNNELLAPSSEFVGGFGGEVASSTKTEKFEFEDLKQEKKNAGKNIEEVDFGLYQRHREAIIKVARDIGKLQAQDYSKELHLLLEELAGKVTDRTMGIIRHSIIAPVMMPAVSFSTEVLSKHLMEFSSKGKISGISAGDDFVVEGKEDNKEKLQNVLETIDDELSKEPKDLSIEETKKFEKIKQMLKEKCGGLKEKLRDRMAIQVYNLSSKLEQNPSLEGTKFAMALPLLPPPSGIISNTNEITTDVPLFSIPSSLSKAFDTIVEYYTSDDPTRLLIMGLLRAKKSFRFWKSLV